MMAETVLAIRATLYDYRQMSETYLFKDGEDVNWSQVSKRAVEYCTKNKSEFTKYGHTFKNKETGYYWYQMKAK